MSDAALRPRAVLDGALLATAACAVYVLLGQDTFYGVDGQGIVELLARGGTGHYLHFLYLPAVRGFAALVAPLGLGPYHVAVLASAAGTAVGVFLTHAAALLLGQGRRRAAVATLLVATTPAVVFFATVVEFHGVFFAFAGLAWVALAWLVRRPSLGRAVLAGMATCLAGFVHGTGQLLVVLVPAWFVADAVVRRRDLRRSLVLAAAAVATHGALLWVVPRLAALPLGNQVEYWGYYLDRLPPAAEIPGTLWSEWLFAFAPLSVLWLPALGGPGRPRAAAVGAVLLVYLATSFLLVPDGSERGAYEVPLAFAAALLALDVVPARGLVAAALAGLVLGVVQVDRHDTDRTSAGWVAALRAATGGERAVFLAGDLAEVNALAQYAPDVDLVPFHEWISLVGQADARDLGRFFTRIDAWLDARWRGGRTVYLCRGARAWLDGPRSVPAGRLLLDHLRARYRLEPVERPPFAALRIVRRR